MKQRIVSCLFFMCSLGIYVSTALGACYLDEYIVHRNKGIPIEEAQQLAAKECSVYINSSNCSQEEYVFQRALHTPRKKSTRLAEEACNDAVSRKNFVANASFASDKREGGMELEKREAVELVKPNASLRSQEFIDRDEEAIKALKRELHCERNEAEQLFKDIDELASKVMMGFQIVANPEAPPNLKEETIDNLTNQFFTKDAKVCSTILFGSKVKKYCRSIERYLDRLTKLAGKYDKIIIEYDLDTVAHSFEFGNGFCKGACEIYQTFEGYGKNKEYLDATHKAFGVYMKVFDKNNCGIDKSTMKMQLIEANQTLSLIEYNRRASQLKTRN